MKKQQLQNIIKEELKHVLTEDEGGAYNLNKLFIQFILKDLKGAEKRATEIGQILKREMAKGHPYIADVSPEEVITKLKNIWKAYSIGLPKSNQELLK